MDTLPLGLAEPAERYEPGTADRIARGVCRRLSEIGYRSLLEFRVGIGRRADVAALDATGRFVIVEIKSSLADFRSDAKWPEYLPYCDAYYFAVADGFPQEVLPAEHGLIVADEHDAVILREAPHRPMLGSRRKAQILRFGLVAASRLSYVTGFAPREQDWRED
jgi:hypothetical protein